MNEAAFRELISGEKRGALAACCRPVLSGLSFFYGLGVRARNSAFDLALKKTHKAAVPVVSVGNITTGGTGKTPFVAFLTNWFRERDIRVVLLSRGYRALPDAVNDEKLVLDLLCPGVPHLQNPDRVKSAEIASDEHRAQLIILDDGFQHRRLDRDLDIVLIDALCPWGYGRLLPRGLLREPISELARAELIVLTRAGQCSEAAKEEILARIARVHGEKNVVEISYPPARLVNSAGETAELSSLGSQQIAAFCGIGNPAGFQQTLTTAGIPIAEEAFRAFPDHHHYSDADLDQLAELASATNARALLTTQKDLVKINQTHLGETALWAVEIGTKILSGSELLYDRLEEIAEDAGLVVD